MVKRMLGSSGDENRLGVLFFSDLILMLSTGTSV